MELSVNPIQAGCLEEYAMLTGTPVQNCLDSAIDDWIRTVAAEVISQDKKFHNVIMMPRREA